VTADVTSFARTLDQELAALLRGASLECLACGEFVMHRAGAILCPECGSSLRKAGSAECGLPLTVQAG
jgi:Zn finger protein HypA/HybF involved in hydrogenase expression